MLSLRRQRQRCGRGRNAQIADKSWHKAHRKADKILALTPDDPSMHATKDNCLRAIGRTAKAIDSYNRSIYLDPHNDEASSNKGLSLSSLLYTSQTPRDS